MWDQTTMSCIHQTQNISVKTYFTVYSLVKCCIFHWEIKRHSARHLFAQHVLQSIQLLQDILYILCCLKWQWNVRSACFTVEKRLKCYTRDPYGTMPELRENKGWTNVLGWKFGNIMRPIIFHPHFPCFTYSLPHFSQGDS